MEASHENDDLPIKKADEPSISIPKWTWWPIQRRYLMALLSFFGFVHVYFLRVNMSFAIVAMNRNYSIIEEDGNITYQKDFNWSSKERGLILGSFFWGYITTQIIGGFLAPKIGAARLIGLSAFCTSILTLSTPLAASNGGLIPLMVLRLFQGIFQGVAFPAQVDLFSYWVPPVERTRLVTIAYSGIHTGTFLTMTLCGIISQYLGWKWIFYLSGTSSIIWCLLWAWQIYEQPSKDPYITAEEKNYIISSIGPLRRAKFTEAPWKCIFTSVPVWAAWIAFTCQNTGFYTLLTQLPTFLNDVAGLRLDQMGVLASLPYLGFAIVMQITGHLADFFRSRLKIPTTTVRKLFTSGCHIIQMSFLLVTSQVTHSPALVVTCLTIAVASGGLSGLNVIYLDMAPQYASFILGVGNSLATLPGMISPSITGYIVQNKLASEWMTVFYIVSAVYIVGIIEFSIFASGERQPWAANKTKAEDEAFKKLIQEAPKIIITAPSTSTIHDGDDNKEDNKEDNKQILLVAQ